MNLHLLDWLMLLVPLGLVLIIAAATRKYTRSVADFMAANRCAGRYLVAQASNEAAYGAISTVAMFEQSGGFELEVSWSGPGIPKQRIPASALCRPK